MGLRALSMLFIAWVIIASSGCTSKGPKVTVCIVDVKHDGFQCVQYPNTRYFLPAKDGKNLLCASPAEIEDAIKACEKHQILQITLCKLKSDLDGFTCKNPQGHESNLPWGDSDNYGCMTQKDFKRILERCDPPKLPSEQYFFEDEEWNE